jgi:hypothetical protein
MMVRSYLVKESTSLRSQDGTTLAVAKIAKTETFIVLVGKGNGQ